MNKPIKLMQKIQNEITKIHWMKRHELLRKRWAKASNIKACSTIQYRVLKV